MTVSPVAMMDVDLQHLTPEPSTDIRQGIRINDDLMGLLIDNREPAGFTRTAQIILLRGDHPEAVEARGLMPALYT